MHTCTHRHGKTHIRDRGDLGCRLPGLSYERRPGAATTSFGRQRSKYRDTSCAAFETRFPGRAPDGLSGHDELIGANDALCRQPVRIGTARKLGSIIVHLISASHVVDVVDHAVDLVAKNVQDRKCYRAL